jgi:simple sugar transport system permease protein
MRTFHVIKREPLSRKKQILIRLLYIFGAILMSSLFILAAGANPIEVFVGIISGSLGTMHRFSSTIAKTVPLIILSLGILVAFKMKFWNIGAEGQFLIGGVGATFIVLNFPDLPLPLMLILMAAVAMVFGAIWLLIPAIFKAKFNTNETLFTLMMNYIALSLVTYLQYDAWKDPGASGMPKIISFPANAVLPEINGFNIGIIIAAVLVIAMYFYMNHSKTGYEISVLGESPNTAKYVGINTSKTMIKGVLISGALCGLVGMIQTSGVSGTLSVELTGGMGFTAIITTWLSGLSAPMIVLTSFLFGILIQGGSYIQTAFQIPASVAEVIQGLILFFVLASEFLLRYRIVRKEGGKKA